MTTGVLLMILAVSLVGIAAVGWFLWRGHHKDAKKGPKGASSDVRTEAQKDIDENVDHIFNDEFREELRNHGRLYFDKIIGENAMFLQQDLRLTSSQLNEYMKKEINTKLQEAFGSYEQSMKDAQAVAMRAAETQRAALEKQTQELLVAEKERAMKHFEDNMADIVNHYLAEAFGNQVSLEDQLGYIVGEMEANKEAMKQDMHA
jgi:hypothetical protein